MLSIKFFKCIIIILSIIILSICSIYSNNIIGFKTGFGISNEYNNLANLTKKISYDFTINYFVPNIDFHDLKLNLGYKNRGYKGILFADYAPKIKSGYLIQDYHLLFFGPEIIISRNERWKELYYLLGFNISYLLNHDPVFGFNFDDGINSFRRVQYDINLGVGYNISSKLFVEINGNCNLIDKIKSTDRQRNAKAYDYYIGVSLGYNFVKNYSN